MGCGTVGSPIDVHRAKRRTVAPPDRRLTVGRGVALPLSVPLPSLGRQQSGRHWRCTVHGGRGPPYHSGSCSPCFSGYDLCGVPVRRRGPACSSRPPCGLAAGAGGRVTLRLPSPAGGALRGQRAAPVAPQLGWVRGGGGGGVGGPPPRPLSSLCGRGGGEWGGPSVPWRCLLSAKGGGGGLAVPAPGASHLPGGSRPSPAPLYREPDSHAVPLWGPSSPGRCRAALAGRGWP